MFFFKILLAKDKELNRWCSLKKALQRRPENVEKYDQIAYSKKATNVALKQKLLPSLFVETQKATNDDEKSTNMQKDVVENNDTVSEDIVEQPIAQAAQTKKKKKEVQKQQKSDNTPKDVVEDRDTISKDVVEQVTAKAAHTKKKKKGKKKGAQKQQNGGVSSSEAANGGVKTQIETKSVKEAKTKKRKRVDSEQSNHKLGGKKGKKNSEVKINISDSRLTAFGINPKKYKNKLKYGNKQKN